MADVLSYMKTLFGDSELLPAGGPGVVPSDDLYALHRARNTGAAATDKLTQDLLGPKEHEQFVQETTSLNPIVGTAVLAMTPVYSAAKALGIKGAQGRSAASIDEIIGGAAGYAKGLKQYFSGGATPREKPTILAGEPQ